MIGFYKIKKIDQVLCKLGESATESVANIFAETNKEYVARKRAEHRQVSVKRAKSLDLTPCQGMEDQIRRALNERIIFEVKRLKLKHREVASIIQSSRPNVTAILNRRIDSFSTDTLIKILAMLGVFISVHFESK